MICVVRDICVNHICDLDENRKNDTTADGREVIVKCIGTLHLSSTVDGRCDMLRLHDVTYAQGLRTNLIHYLHAEGQMRSNIPDGRQKNSFCLKMALW